MASIKNEKGTISIANDAIAALTGNIITNSGFYGIVGMAAKRAADGLYELLNRENLAKGVRVTANEQGELSIELHIIVEYGVPISAVATSTIEAVTYHVSEATGLAVNRVDIVVEGVRV
ncbi:MAG: Asp23/Gls24 family envelope stress response protein [Eubacteriales bacterium]|nr:Asp23/Gls24 family envelope stress response protein [Eubacteriales bacterium]